MPRPRDTTIHSRRAGASSLVMKICGACEKELPRESFSGKQWSLRKSLQRCSECVAAGKELALFTKGRKRSADDECPICSRLLPLDEDQATQFTCCMKIVCNGCDLEAEKRGIYDCPSCRTPPPESDESDLDRIQKRVKINDPEAVHYLGLFYRDGVHGLEKDLTKAFELFERAAALGSSDAHFDIGDAFDGSNESTYDFGFDTDMTRAIEHYELAAKQGHARARRNLGMNSSDTGNKGLALKHWMISAKLGDKDSLDYIKEMYMEGLPSKIDYAEALRGYQEAIEEMSSPERDEAKALRDSSAEGFVTL